MFGSLQLATCGVVLGMISVTTGFASPINDNFVDREDLGSAFIVNASGDNFGATGEVGEPSQSGLINSAWWSWTAPANAMVVIDTAGSTLDTFLTLATGSVVSALTVLDQDDDGGPGLQSAIGFVAFRGTEYQLAVDGFGSNEGNIVLNIVSEVPEPATWMLMCTGLVALAFIGCRRRKQEEVASSTT